MEEELKILELTLEDSKDYGQYCLTRTELDAIETLLTRYKELEEENKILKEITNSYNAFGNDYIPNDMKFIIADREYFHSGIFKESFIPISVIQNKKKYWEQEHHIAGEHLVVQVLDELLEERSK